MAHDLLPEHTGAHSHPHHSPSGPSLWEILWQRKAYVLLGVVVGVALGVLYYAMAPRTYESTAQVFVVKKTPDRPISAPTATNPHGTLPPPPAEDFLDTHQTILKSAVVVEAALDRGRLADLPTFRESPRPARDLVEALKVGRDRDRSAARMSNSQVLNISFRGRHPDDCQQVLGSIVDSYQEFLNRSTRGSASEALKLISKARDLVQNDLKQEEAAYAEFRRNTPVLWKTQQGTTLYQERLSAIDAQRAALTVRSAQARATLAAVEAAIHKGVPREQLLELLAPSGRAPAAVPPSVTTRGRGMPLIEEASFAPPTSTLEQELIQLRLEENRLLSDFGPRHPQVQNVRERIQTLSAMLAPSTTRPGETEEQRRRQRQAKENLVDLKIAQLRQQVEDDRIAAEALEALFQAELKEAKKVFPYETQDDAMRRSIDRSQQLYKHIINRLQEMDLISSFGGFDAQVITPPTVPEKVSPRASLVLPLSALLGLLLGGGLAYLSELTDRSFRSPEDVRRRLGLPVMGVIPVLKQAAKAGRAVPVEAGAALNPSLCSWYRPKSKEAEAYRGVRTALYFSTRGQGFKVIQVTSPNAGDGKSTLAANLAVSIAQSGRRVLLVDADLRRPRLHQLFGVSNRVGFASLLEGSAEPPDVLLESGVPGLSLLPSGEPPPNPAELLTSPRLAELLAWMRDQYDYVVVDTPPLLAVTDPGVIGPRVDGVLLTLRPTKNGRVDAVRAREILHNLGVNIFGVIVNATEQKQGGYGYYAEGSGYYEDESNAGAGGAQGKGGENGDGLPGRNGTARAAGKE